MEMCSKSETHGELCQRLNALLAALSIDGHKHRPLMGLTDGGSAALLCRWRWHIPSMHHAAPQKRPDSLHGKLDRFADRLLCKPLFDIPFCLLDAHATPYFLFRD